MLRAQVARGVIGVVVIGHFPLNHNPARQGLESLEHYLLGWKHISFGLSCVQTTVFVAVSLAIALTVSLSPFGMPQSARGRMSPQRMVDTAHIRSISSPCAWLQLRCCVLTLSRSCRRCRTSAPCCT